MLPNPFVLGGQEYISKSTILPRVVVFSVADRRMTHINMPKCLYIT